MSSDEVEIGGGDSGDYEVVPVGPIRKLERRLDDIEEKAGSGAGSSPEMLSDVMEIMKSNQKIVNDMTESTHELRNEVEDLTHKMDEVVDNMNSFMDLLEQASDTDLEGEVMSDMHDRIADAIGTEMSQVAQDIHQSNQEVVERMEQISSSMESMDQTIGGLSKQAMNSNRRNSQSTRNSGTRNSSPGERMGDSSRDDGEQSIGSDRRDAERRPQNDSDSQGMNIDREGQERMNKLRKKFENIE